jgi:hypothetical protein
MVRNRLVAALAIAGALGGAATFAPRPALALDDGKGNSLMDVLDFVGLGEKKDDDVIFYRERAPLVLPPKTELRQPAPPAQERTANWPKDPEVVRAQKRAAENRARQAESISQDPNYAGKLTREGRINPADVRDPAGPGGRCSMTPDAVNKCDPNTYWQNLAVKSDAPKKNVITAGQEPEREFLTSPPKGYLAAKNNVAANSQPAQQDLQPSIFDYFRNGGK